MKLKGEPKIRKAMAEDKMAGVKGGAWGKGVVEEVLAQAREKAWGKVSIEEEGIPKDGSWDSGVEGVGQDNTAEEGHVASEAIFSLFKFSAAFVNFKTISQIVTSESWSHLEASKYHPK